MEWQASVSEREWLESENYNNNDKANNSVPKP